jgi:hypothetical protein
MKLFSCHTKYGSKIFIHASKFAAATTTAFNPLTTACDDESDEESDNQQPLRWRESAAEPRVLTYGIGWFRVQLGYFECAGLSSRYLATRKILLKLLRIEIENYHIIMAM